MTPTKFSHYDEEINAEAKKSAETAGRETGNIEDQIRVANELLRRLEIIAESDPSSSRGQLNPERPIASSCRFRSLNSCR